MDKDAKGDLGFSVSGFIVAMLRVSMFQEAGYGHVGTQGLGNIFVSGFIDSGFMKGQPVTLALGQLFQTFAKPIK